MSADRTASPGFAIARAFATAVAMAAATGSLPGQSAAVFKGNVIVDGSNKPVPVAEVRIPAQNLVTHSDSSGAFRFAAVAAGNFDITVRKLGFAPLSTLMTFVTGDSVDVDLLLDVVRTRLPEVAVTAAAAMLGQLAEFEARRASGLGHFVTPDQLEKADGSRLSELLSRAGGARVVQGNTNAAWVSGSRGVSSRLAPAMNEMDRRKGAKPGLCYSAIVLDGSFVYQGLSGESLFDVNSLNVQDLAGVEVYSGPATMPAKYNGTRVTCGLVVIWTK